MLRKIYTANRLCRMQDPLLRDSSLIYQSKLNTTDPSPKTVLHGTGVAMYIVGQERRLVDPPSQVVAGVRTVTTKMNERCGAHVAALIRFLEPK